jgi:hypothetical protein
MKTVNRFQDETTDRRINIIEKEITYRSTYSNLFNLLRAF